ncbi:hypothetical protein EMIHUDRAFT_70855, partial [Emiliania huxleyi CCMP1516]|uniref:DNA 3'-5' helicase n=2 Tax=Emiliania huxleyi TaxID=2903 RepID=A0A0D3KKL8_EMIH1
PIFAPWQRVFGYSEFRSPQRAIINATMSQTDVFVIMPTGGGKSLCYQLPALLERGLTVVVCPLISLIEDQVFALRQWDVSASFLATSQDADEAREVMHQLHRPALVAQENGLRLLYVTPERITSSPSFTSALTKLYNAGQLRRFLIMLDEAHCVSQWGHDFRKDYKELCKLRHNFPQTPIMALTATATKQVAADVLNILGIRQTAACFNTPNLRYEVLQKKKKCAEDLAKVIAQKHANQTGIVYCCSRRDCETLADELCKEGQAGYYHADLDPLERRATQQRWMNDELRVICATVAFGMGINKADVRFVVHHSLPKSLEGCTRGGGGGGVPPPLKNPPLPGGL